MLVSKNSLTLIYHRFTGLYLQIICLFLKPVIQAEFVLDMIYGITAFNHNHDFIPLATIIIFSL